MNHETQADEKKLYHLFRKVGMDENGALTAVQEIRTMAGQNILAKIDEQSAKMQNRFTKIDSEIRSTNRIMGFFGVVIGLFLAALNIAIYVMNK